MLEMSNQHTLNRNNNKNKTDLRVLQWNCHSLSTKEDAPTTLFPSYDIIALSETWLTASSYYSLKDFIIFRKDSLSRHARGLLLAIRNTLSYTIIDNSPQFDERMDSMAVSIHFKNFDLTVVFIYRAACSGRIRCPFQLLRCFFARDSSG